MEFIPIANPKITEEEAKAAYDVIKSGWISMGKKVEEFENNIADYLNVKHVIVMNNGTSTLNAALLALDIQPGDEIIVPSLTYISSANVVEYLGAKLVLCDNDINTFNVNVENIIKTKAFMTVDLKGLPINYDQFVKLSDETGIPFIADSAESFGATYKGKKVGSQALIHSFSFFANKNMTTGEGGACVTNNADLASKLRIIRNQGQEGRYNHTHLGNNFRMTDILAAIGIEQLKKIDYIQDEKVKLAEFYKKSFEKSKYVEPPFVPDYVDRPSWYMYGIKVNELYRDKLLKYLENNFIECRLSFPPVHIQPYFKNKYNYLNDDYPIAYKSFKSFLDIPIWAGIGDEKLIYIINEINGFLSKKM